MRKKLLTVISIIVILFMNFLVSEIYADEEYGGSTDSQTSVQYYNSNGTTSDVTFSAATNGFTRRGYSFVKWADGDAPTTLYAETQSIIYNPQYDSSTLVKIMYATWQANELTFENQTITKSYSTSQQTANVTPATNGTGLYIYTKKSGEANITVSPTGVITIPAGKAAGTYTVVITATDSNSNMSKDATYTIKINPIPTTNTVTITGTPTFGQTLTANVETSSDGTKHYQWYYATSKDATSGTNITDATNATYTIANVGSTSMVGKYIGCKVTIDAGTNWNAHTGATATTQTAVAKATPTLTLGANGAVDYNATKNFSVKASVAGSIVVTSKDTTCVTVTANANTTLAANTAKNVTVKGIKAKDTATNVEVVFTPTDSANYNSVTKNYSVTKVNKLTVGAPSGLTVSTAGIVTWTAGTNSNAHEISIDGTNWTTATSGVNYLSTIIGATGTRTVYVRAKNTDTTNYTTPSSNATKAVTVRTLTTSSNNTNYGTLDSSTYNVISGVTYETSNNTLVVKSGTTTLKTITASPKTGYSFTSWSSASGTISANTTVTATFTANIYSVTLDNKNATTAGTTKIYYQYNTTKTIDGVTCYYYTDQALTNPLNAGYKIEKPAKTGYTFGGYYTEENGEGTQYVNASGSFINSIYQTAQDRTLYAKWTANDYKVTYNYNTSDYTFSTTGYLDTNYIVDWNKDFTLTSTVNIPTTGNRYLIFGNYVSTSSTSKDLSLEINASNKIRVWINGTQKALSTETVAAGTDINFVFTWVASTKTYTFTSTGTNSNATVTGTYSITGSPAKTLRIGTQDHRGSAAYKPYTLKGASITEMYTYGNTLSNLPTEATNVGYTFNGWYTAASNGNQITTSTSVPSSNTTYYAHWTGNALTFTNQTITKEYSTSQQTANVTYATNGTGTYTYTKKSGESNITVSTAGVITIPASKNAGTYTIVITAKDSNSNVTKDATYTIKINPIPTTNTVTITGTPTFGQTLTANVETSSDGTKHYQWYYATSKDATSGTNITDATNATYTIANVGSTSMVGKYIGCKVTIDAGTNWNAHTGATATTQTAVAKATPTLTLGANGAVNYNATKNFSVKANVAGSIVVTSKDTTCVQVTANANTTLAANTAKNVTVKGIKAKATATTVEVVFTPTDSANYEVVTKNYSVTKVNKLTVGAPSNVAVSTAGIVTWTAGSNANAHEISIDNSTWTTATSGVNYLSTIIGGTGTRTVYVRAKNTDTTNYTSPSSNATKDVTVYAVTLASNSTTMGTVSPTTYNVISGTTYTTSSNTLTIKGVTSGTTTADLKTITASPKTGYSFSSWSSTSGTINANTTLTATFAENTYTIAFNNNTGSGTMSSITGVKYTESKTLTTNTFTKTGYTFNGWNTKANGTGTSYTNGQSVSKLSATNGATVTLYAQWTANQYKLVKVSNNNLVKNGDFETYTIVNAPSKTANGATHTWDINLNGIPGNTSKAYSATSWGTGANMGVAIPEIGYHGHMKLVNNNALFSFKTNEDYAGKTKADLPDGITVGGDSSIATNRWLGISQSIPGTNLIAGNTYAMTVDIYRVSGSNRVTGGLLYKTTSNTTKGFQSGQCNLAPSTSGQWETLTWTFTLASDYINTDNPSIYIYGNTGGAGELYVDNVRLEDVTILDKNYDTAYTTAELATLTRTGYTFNGWYNNASLTTNLTTSSTFNNTTATFQNINTAGTIAKIYAKWTANPLTFANQTITKNYSTSQQTASITAASNGTGTYTYTEKSEKNSAGTATNYISISGTTINIAASTPAGTYTYVITATDSNSNVTKDATYTITINKVAATNSVKITGTNTYGKTLTASVTTNSDGAKTYQWWYATSASATTGTAIPNATSATYTIANAGSTSLTGKYIGVTVNIAAGTNWNAATASNDITDATNNGSATVLNTYKIRFNGNGATSGSMSDLSMIYGTAKNLTANAFKKDDKGFAGWATSATATDATYTDGQEVNNLTTTNGAIVNLYAVWADAELLEGWNFNKKIKELAGHTGSVTEDTADTNITEFKMSETKPTAENMTSNNLISLSTSKIPVYAWFDNGTIYWWSEDTTPLCNADSRYMFNNCSGLTSLDLSSFDTVNVTNMSYMFRSCSSLTSLNLSNFNTAKVTNMSYMFDYCSGLTSLNVSSFNTAQVTNMSYMFDSCSSLTSLNLSNFNTAKVTNMSYMFRNCSSLTSLDLSSFNTAKVTDMSFMFSECYSLTSLNLSNFNTTQVINMRNMFSRCRALTSLNISSFNTAKVTNMNGMFAECYSLTNLNLSNFNTAQVNDMQNMFGSCGSLTSLNISSFNTANVTNMNYMFLMCSSLTSLDLSSFNTAQVTTMSSMFDGCDSLISLDLSSFNTAQVTNMSSMILSCDALTTIYATDNFVTTNVTSSSRMFESDTNLVGGNGTVYNSSYNDKTYARIDRPGTPGYFTGRFTITLDSSGATTAGTQTIYETQGEKYSLTLNGDAITSITKPAKTGYNFIGYYTEANGAGTKCIDSNGKIIVGNRQFTANTTLYAYFAKEYTIRFNGNGATSGSMSDLPMVYGTAKNLTANAFKKEGKGFAGWATSATATDATYTDGQEVNNLTTTNGAIVNLYAVWADAELLSGEDFNIKIKTLAGNTGTVTHSTENTTITQFKKSSTKPTSANMTSNNLISLSTSKVPVYAWFDNGTIYWWSEDTTPLCNRHSASMFEELEAMVNLELTGFDTSNVTNMSYMFSYCGYTAMTSLDLGENFDTSNVTDMHYMFEECGHTAMTSLDLGDKFDTSNVTNMNCMFRYCGYTAMTSLDLGDKFDTSNVKFMSSMFSCCGYTAMTSLDLGDNFDTSNVTNMSYMFASCGSTAMTSLELGDKFDTSNVTNMSYMFDSCGSTAMTSLDLGDKFDTSNVTNMSKMFHNINVKTIYAPSDFDTTSLTSSTNMFTGATNLVGGNGTAYNSSHLDKEYARIDRSGTPGYFTLKGVHKITLNNQSATSAGTPAIYETYGSQYSLSHGGTETTTITVPTRTGYTFGGYYSATNGGGTQYINASGTITASNTTFTGATTIYAKWTANTYTLSYDSNMYYANNTSSSGLSVSYSPLTSVLTLNGTSTATGTGISLFRYPGLTFTANDKYTMTLTYQSGSYSSTASSPAADVVVDIQTDSNANVSTRNATAPVLPTSGSKTATLTVNSAGASEGKQFYYWLWFREGQNKYTFNNYKVRVDFTKVQSQTVTYGSPYGTLITPTKLGYTFGGWFTGYNGAGNHIYSTTNVTTASNHTLFAKWTVSAITNASFTSSLTILRGNTASTSLTYSGVAKTVAYTTSDSTVATVNSSGVVTAASNKTGTATITATITDYNGTKTTKTCSVTVNMGVAQANSKDYSSIQNAINSISSSGTVTLLVNTTESPSIASSKTITLNLGGKTLTGKITVDGNGNLNISNGNITNDGTAIRNNGTGTITINSGTYTNTLASSTLTGATSAIYNVLGGKIIMNNGTLNTTNGAGITNGGTVTIKNGTINANGSGDGINGGTINVEGGTIKGRMGIYTVNSGTTITVSGGIIEGKSDVGIRNVAGTTTIKGGTISGSTHGIYNDNGTLTIENGTIEGKDGTGVTIVAAVANASIKGGTIKGTKQGVLNYKGTVTINMGTGGKITGQTQGLLNYETGTITISSGTIEGTESYGAWNYSSGTINVNGGKITGQTQGLVNYNTGTITISSGTIEGKESYGAWNYSSGTINLNGGTLKGYTSCICNQSTGTINVNGGTATGTNNYGVSQTGTGKVYLKAGTVQGKNYSVYNKDGTIYYRATTLKRTSDNTTGTGTIYGPWTSW